MPSTHPAPRDPRARPRDLAAEARDETADARDRSALARDDAALLLARVLPDRGDSGSAARMRVWAAADRVHAATDREQAGLDRAYAAREAERARADLECAQLDGLTGAYQRQLGEVELSNEIARARRTGGGLVLAFVDVDGLKVRNDGEGHAAGDALLRSVVAAIRSHLRSYDPIVRVGGDEFVCGLSNTDLAGARRRFDEISDALREADDGASISVGLAALTPGDSLPELTARGDAALYRAKETHARAAAA
jgi:diguanylate cyclase (GGDEF)-like protein